MISFTDTEISFLSKKERRDIKTINQLIKQDITRDIKFYDKQQQVLDCTNNKILVSGGYGSGKTIVSLLKFLNMLKQAGGKGIATGFSYNTLYKLILDTLDTLSIQFKFNSLTSEIITEYGAFYIYGMDTIRSKARIRSLNLSTWYADEITLQDREACLEVMARLRSVSNPKWIWSTNPDSPHHWVYSYTQEEDIQHFQFQTTNNPFLPKDYVKNLGLHPQSSQYIRMVEGEWVTSDDSPFANIKIEELSTDNYTHAYIDPALEGKDFTAISLMKEHNGKLIVRGYMYKKSIAETIETIGDLVAGCHQVFYEKNGVGLFPYKYFQQRDITAIPIHSTEKKELRILKIENLVRNGTLILDSRSDKEYIKQVINWSVDSKEHDDAPDSLSGVLIKTGKVI